MGRVPLRQREHNHHVTLNTEFTIVKLQAGARGNSGPQGPMGAAGDDGATGDKGDKGDRATPGPPALWASRASEDPSA